LSVDDPDGNYIADSHVTGDFDGEDGARVTFTARSTGFYTIRAATDYSWGRYKLRVE
jgi:hypothetical protein